MTEQLVNVRLLTDRSRGTSDGHGVRRGYH